MDSRSSISPESSAICLFSPSISCSTSSLSSSADFIFRLESSISSSISLSSALRRRMASSRRSSWRINSFLRLRASSRSFLTCDSSSLVWTKRESTSAILLRSISSWVRWSSISLAIPSLRLFSSSIFDESSAIFSLRPSTSMSPFLRWVSMSDISDSVSVMVFWLRAISPFISSICRFIAICSSSPMLVICTLSSLSADSSSVIFSCFSWSDDSSPVSPSSRELISSTILSNSFLAFLNLESSM